MGIGNYIIVALGMIVFAAIIAAAAFGNPDDGSAS